MSKVVLFFVVSMFLYLIFYLYYLLSGKANKNCGKNLASHVLFYFG